MHIDLEINDGCTSCWLQIVNPLQIINIWIINIDDNFHYLF